MNKLILSLAAGTIIMAGCTPKGKIDPNDNTPANITVTLIENAKPFIVKTNHPKEVQVTRGCPPGTTQRSASSATGNAVLDPLDLYIFDGNFPVQFFIASSDTGGGIKKLVISVASDDTSGSALTNLSPSSAISSYKKPQNAAHPHDTTGGGYSIEEDNGTTNPRESDSVSFDFNPAPSSRYVWINVDSYDVNGNYANKGVVLGRQSDFCQ